MAETVRAAADPAGAFPWPSAVLWDMDGTLVDSEPLWAEALDEAAAELGRPLTAAVHERMTGTDDRTTMRMLVEYTGASIGEAELDALHDRIVARVVDMLRTAVPVHPDAPPTLRALRGAGVPMAVVTSSPASVTATVLERLGRELFDAVVTAADVERRKPDPAPYLLAAELLGVAPDRCWAVEDSPSGAESAQRAGCRVFLVPDAVPAARTEGRRPLAALTELAELLPAG
ncbi:HAD family hydrolase [Allonocardiopsis opalescens]|uniref:HAD superfamily hydrolase (TIGR01509 family) n=1 Tax=Allonocardiopsis opalescens TaxID=1144618 RepID=A0A2T0Q0D9_9ACTN|nr:HAD family phosphatase [Allonocardiopsis opalescens]PRX97261.1 HAD superfamily hydrolase (TIGR01509 family) [Allonocardiopsis opalescens]